ncbi:MAG TPA: membrane protein insertion efficiency factor YidD [Chloroflexota bacterium]|nr:membrane protein insertion efficiency factor YidD [Chloroflexota bacterium]
MKGFLLLTIRFYQRAISPGLPSSCRFEPSCSRYAYEAIGCHGAMRGSWLALRRLLRCTPLRTGGYDPVPDVVSRETLPAGRRPG